MTYEMETRRNGAERRGRALQNRISGPVDVLTDGYTFAHGKRPRGVGSWAFGIGDHNPPMEKIYWMHNTRYAAAKAAAQAEARKRGVSTVWVLS